MQNRRRARLVYSLAIVAAGILFEDAPLRAEERNAPHDNFSAALRLPGSPRAFTRTVQIYLGTPEPGEPPYRGEPVFDSVWARWTPSRSGVVELEASKRGYALKLDVFEGDSLDALMPLAANRVTPDVRSEGAIWLRVMAGRTYAIRLQDVPTPYHFVNYGVLRMRYLPDDLARRWPERQLIASQHGTFSVHPALLGHSAGRQFNGFWRTAPAQHVQRSWRQSGGGSYGNVGLVVVTRIPLPPPGIFPIGTLSVDGFHTPRLIPPVSER